MVAVHSTNWGFTPDWISYLKDKAIPFKLVNCYSTNIIEDLNECDILLWHHHHSDAKDVVFAKQLLFALEQGGKKVFPNFNTGWHFDDKVGQKYLLETLQIPTAKSFIFFDKQAALEWAKKAEFPKVFKLRGGAGSSNVRLVENTKDAIRLIRKAFGIGFPSYDKWGDLQENWRKYRLGKSTLIEVAKSFRRIFYSTKYAKVVGPERGYILFQEFAKENAFDIRVITIGERAFAIKRLVRENDFRASGSGFLVYDPNEIDIRCVKLAFEAAKKLNAQVVAYDFVFKEGAPLIVEINYGYAHQSYFDCPGYWDSDLTWHDGKFNSAHWIVELIISQSK